MTGLRRIIFAVLVVLSLALCVATLALWATAQRVGGYVEWLVIRDRPLRDLMCQIWVQRNGVRLYMARTVWRDPAVPDFYRASGRTGAHWHGSDAAIVPADSFWKKVGLGARSSAANDP